MTLDLFPQSSTILARPTGGFGSSTTSCLVQIGGPVGSVAWAEPRTQEATR